MKSRTRRLARLARLLDQRKASLAARQIALAAEVCATDERRRELLKTVDGALAAHGLFVDLLAASVKRLDEKAQVLKREEASLAVTMRDNARRRLRLVEARQAGTVRDEAREREKRDLMDLIDAASGASFRKGP
jgi:hypothetical protein